MSSGNAQLGFAIRAVNEASDAIREITGDLGFMENAASGAEPELRDLSRALGDLETDVQNFAGELEDAGGKFAITRDGLDQVAEGAGNLERFLIGAKDILGVMPSQFDAITGPAVAWAQTAADVAGGLEGVIAGGSALVEQIGPMVTGIGGAVAATWAHVTALGAQAVAFAVANAPLLLIIGGIALLAAGIVLLVQHWDDIKPHIQPVIDFFNDDVVPAANAVWEKGLKPVIDFITDHWKEITALILAPFAPIIILATDAFGIRSKTVEAITGLLSDIAGLGDKITGAGEAMGGALKDGFITGVKGLVSVTGSIVEGIFEAIKFLINGAVDAINDLIPNEIGFDVGAFGVSKHISIDLPDNPIPHLAEGGIVRARPGGTLALLGEAGQDEAVIPLRAAPVMFESGGGGGATHNTYNVTINAMDARSFEDFLRHRGLTPGVMDLIVDEARRRTRLA
ncbi:MAG: hypothetical protein AB7J35_00465 [Dehalococcoidia bacterium]